MASAAMIGPRMATMLAFLLTDAPVWPNDLHPILSEAVDRRGGTKSLSGVTNSWNDVEEAYRFWAEKLRYRLCQWRGGMSCVEPKA